MGKEARATTRARRRGSPDLPLEVNLQPPIAGTSRQRSLFEDAYLQHV